MITLGLRAAPSALTFVVYDSETQALRNVEMIRVPSAFRTPDALKYVRNNVLDVLREYAVVRAGIRTSEPVAQQHSVERIQIEGVLQEAFASSSLDDYFAGPIASVCHRLGVDRADFKPMVNGRNDFDIDGWAEMTREGREAALCAIGAANA